jgi:hypothetical protein
LTNGWDGGAGLSEGLSAAKNSCANSSSWSPSIFDDAAVCCGREFLIWVLTSLNHLCRRGAK